MQGVDRPGQSVCAWGWYRKEAALDLSVRNESESRREEDSTVCAKLPVQTMNVQEHVR